MTRLEKRCMAFLVGIHAQAGLRVERSRIAAALKRSERTVKRAIASLVNLRWITISGGGRGIPSLITVVNNLDWKMACVEKMARVAPKMARVEAENGPCCADLSLLKKSSELSKERGLPVENKTPDSTTKPELTDEQKLRRLARRIDPEALPMELYALMERLNEDGALLLDPDTVVSLWNQRRKPVATEITARPNVQDINEYLRRLENKMRIG